MKDHVIAQLVNALRDCAVNYCTAQQLREQIAALIVPVLRGERAPESTVTLALANHQLRKELRSVLIAVDSVFEYDTPGRIATLMREIGPLMKRHDVSQSGWGSGTAAKGFGAGFDPSADALQQSSSGITAGAENASQVVDFGAAGPNRTGDLLITNQDKNTPETSQNQDVTPKTAPAQPAQIAPTESSGCEGVTAALDLIKTALSDAGRLTGVTEEAFPKLTRLTRDSLIKAHDAWHDVAAQWADRDPNARWLTLAHNLCTDASVPSGHIADRLEGLRAALQAKQKQSVAVTRIGFGTYEVRMNCVTDTAINGLGGGFPAHLKAGDTFVCKLGADFTVDGKPMPIRDVLVAWANYMGKQLVFTGEHDTGEFTP